MDRPQRKWHHQTIKSQGVLKNRFAILKLVFGSNVLDWTISQSANANGFSKRWITSCSLQQHD